MEYEGNLLPILGLLIPVVSLIIAILTYLRVSRKFLSKTLHFPKKIKPNEECVLFHVGGMGSLQKIELTAQGRSDATITLIVDGQVSVRESFASLRNKGSHYLTVFITPNIQGLGRFAIDMNLEKNFFKSLELMITNKDETASLDVKGTVHYNISEHRFHLPYSRKSADG